MAPLHEHKCIHGELERSVGTVRTRQLYGPPPEKQEGRAGAAEALDGMAPVRIAIDTDALRFDPGAACFEEGELVDGRVCEQAQVLTPAKVALLEKDLIPRAVAFFSRLLRVVPVAGNLRLGISRCGFSGGVEVSREYAEHGVPDADIIFFVTARPIGAQSGADTIAYSGHCEVDQFGRPVAAHFNWSPEHLEEPISAFESEYLLRVALHEMTHALVFSPGLFDEFHRQPATTFLPTPSGGRARALISPHTLRVVRRHFGCDSLAGAMLEDGGGAGTGGAHWEMRLFRDEYMTGSASPGVRIISELTLAVFADSGWYSVDASAAEPLAWGRGGGCAFAERSCDDPLAQPVWQRPGYKCSHAQQSGCSYDRRAEAYCDVRRYGNPFPPSLRHFHEEGEEDVGGYSSLLDFCPVFRPYANGNCADERGEWTLTSEERCPSCRCFEKNDGFGAAVASCYRSRCLDATTLEVNVAGRWLRCPTEGGAVPIRVGAARSDAAKLDPLDADNDVAPSPPSDTTRSVEDAHGSTAPRGGVFGWDGGGWDVLDEMYGSETVDCPPAAELCATDASIWPSLVTIYPRTAQWRGGIAITLIGSNLFSLKPPISLSFGLPDGTDVRAEAPTRVNDTHVLATLPSFDGLTYYAHADVSFAPRFIAKEALAASEWRVMLSDSLGRTAYMLGAIVITPSPLEYVLTAALVLLIVVLSIWIVPSYLRAGCRDDMRANRRRRAAKSAAALKASTAMV